MQIAKCPICNNVPDSGKQFGKIFTIWCSTCGLEIAQGGTDEVEITRRWNSLRRHDETAELTLEQKMRSPSGIASKRRPTQNADAKARCICVDFLNHKPDPVPNPDCPRHGAGLCA